MNIKEKIKKIKFFQELMFLKRIKNPEFKSWISDYENCFSIFRFKELGNKNKDKNIFILRFDNEALGFFAYWRFSMFGLAVAERYNLVPVIDWTSNSPYYEQYGIDGIFNPFEYYFEQVSNISIPNAYDSYNVTFLNRQSRGVSNIDYSSEDCGIDFVRLTQKYYKLKPAMKEKLESDIEKLLCGKKTLAVQIRGVEWGKVYGHPVPVSLEKYSNEVENNMKAGNFEQIFIASDSEDSIDYFIKKYPGLVVCYEDVARAKKGSKTLALFDDTIERKNNQFLLGYEVLRDMLTLANCAGLIASYSNISLAAEVFKKGNNEDYEIKSILKNKIMHSGISPKKAVKLMKAGKFDN